MPISKKHYRLTLADALSAHKRALEFGGLPGIASLDLIEAALGRPYTGYYRSIQAKAAAFVQSMAGNHGFTDGNKRTTLLLLLTLIVKSGYELRPIDANEDINIAAEELILAVVVGRISLQDAERWFRARIKRAR